MKVLVACEFSGVVRDAFLVRGHAAVSCDLLPSESASGPHFCGDVFELLRYDRTWDLVIAHPPCTYLCVSGARWWSGVRDKQSAAIEFAYNLLCLPVARVCLENPIGILSSVIRKPDQIIEPWHYGHPETKATCLWLRGLPHLTPTSIVTPHNGSRVHREPPGKDRWKRRSRTLKGIAEAMADQWGGV